MASVVSQALLYAWRGTAQLRTRCVKDDRPAGNGHDQVSAVRAPLPVTGTGSAGWRYQGSIHIPETLDTCSRLYDHVSAPATVAAIGWQVSPWQMTNTCLLTFQELICFTPSRPARVPSGRRRINQ